MSSLTKAFWGLVAVAGALAALTVWAISSIDPIPQPLSVMVAYGLLYWMGYLFALPLIALVGGAIIDSLLSDDAPDHP